jgi:ribose/xylose/arabinose/galactoside ABC-type transport system permease subunit
LAWALCGLLNGVLTAYLALAPFIVTLGTMTFLRGMAYTITEGQPIVSSSLSFRELGNGYLAGIPVPVIIMLIVYLLAWFILERTRFGRHIYAVGGNAVRAPGRRTGQTRAGGGLHDCRRLRGSGRHYLRRQGDFRPAHGGYGI